MNRYMKVQVGDVCEILSGFAFDSNSFTKNINNFPLIRIRDVVRGYTETYYSGEYDEKYVIRKGDILIGMDGEFNIAEWKGKDSLLNQRVCKIICNEKRIFPRYALSFLPKCLKEIEDRTPFVTVKHLSASSIRAIQISLPSLTDQKQIADMLDKVSQLIHHRKQQIEKMDLLVKSQFIELFGDPESNPMGWTKGTIRDVAAEVKYGTSMPSNDGGKYKYLRMNNITYEGQLDLSNLKYIDVDDKELEKYAAQRGDVLFNRTNSKELVGKTCIFNQTEPMVIAGYIIRVRVNELVLPEYLATFLNLPYSKQTLLALCKSAIGQANINAQELQDIAINIPPIDRQKQFSSFLNQVDKSKFVMNQSLQRLEQCHSALIQKAFG